MAESHRVDPIGIGKTCNLAREHAVDDAMDVCSPAHVLHGLPFGFAHGLSGHCDGGKSGEILSAVHGQSPVAQDQTGSPFNGNPKISKPRQIALMNLAFSKQGQRTGGRQRRQPTFCMFCQASMALCCSIRLWLCGSGG